MMKIHIRWDVEPDDIEVRGNACATGDEAEDKKIEDEIISRLDRGDVWAWASVRCEARCEIDGEVFIGRASLGGCSYANAKEFMRDNGDSMRSEALKSLREAMKPDTKRAKAGSKGRLQFHKAQIIEEEKP